MVWNSSSLRCCDIHDTLDRHPDVLSRAGHIKEVTMADPKKDSKKKAAANKKKKAAAKKKKSAVKAKRGAEARSTKKAEEVKEMGEALSKAYTNIASEHDFTILKGNIGTLADAIASTSGRLSDGSLVQRTQKELCDALSLQLQALEGLTEKYYAVAQTKQAPSILKEGTHAEVTTEKPFSVLPVGTS
jgi:hypothetical protein